MAAVRFFRPDVVVASASPARYWAEHHGFIVQWTIFTVEDVPSARFWVFTLGSRPFRDRSDHRAHAGALADEKSEWLTRFGGSESCRSALGDPDVGRQKTLISQSSLVLRGTPVDDVLA